MLEEEEPDEGEMCKCVSCGIEVLCDELEAHICSEHLDYFPYSCGYCSHFFTTDVLAHFHAKTKKHLPMKIREQPEIRKYKKLWRLVELSLEGDEGNRQQIIERMHNRSSSLVPESSYLASKTGGRESSDDSRWNLEASPTAEYHQDNQSEFSAQVSATWTVQAVMDAEELGTTGQEGQSTNEPTGNSSITATVLHELKCNLCGMLILDKDKSVHIHMHQANQNTFICGICSYTSNALKSVRTHVQKKHPDCRPVTKAVKTVSSNPLDLEELSKLCFTSDGLSSEQLASVALVPVKEIPPKPINQTPGKGSKGLSFDPRFSHEATLPNGKVYRFMECRQCGVEVCEAEISTHIYQVHVQWDNMIKCNQCDFQHSYDYAVVKQHIQEAHPGEKMVIKDRRKGCRAQLLLKKWCKICFTGRTAANLGKRAKNSGEGPEKKKKKKKQSHGSSMHELESGHRDALEAELSAFSTPPLNATESLDKSICQKCNLWILKTKVDEHVWLEHNEGELPYKCGKCQKSTITLDEMEKHWTDDHSNTRVPYSTTASCSMMEVIPNPSARPKFDVQMVECFPKDAGDRWAKIKIEPEDDYY